MFELELENGIFFRVESDEFIPGAYHVRLQRDETVETLSNLHLVPLWDDLPQFEEGNFYQKTFTSYPAGQGWGRLLISTLIENLEEAIPNCNTIYSSSWVNENNLDETDYITIDAVAFWDSLVRLNLAERNEEMARYRLLI